MRCRTQTREDCIPRGRRKRAQHARSERSHSIRESADAIPYTAAPEVAYVATEELISSVAGERDRDLTARELRNEKGWNLGRVCEWLVVDPGKLRDYRHRFVRCDVKLRVLGSKVPCNRFRMHGFVVT